MAQKIKIQDGSVVYTTPDGVKLSFLVLGDVKASSSAVIGTSTNAGTLNITGEDSNNKLNTINVGTVTTPGLINVDGNSTVSGQIIVSGRGSTSGSITTDNNFDLEIRTGTLGDIYIVPGPSGFLYLTKYTWPNEPTDANIGMFLGLAAKNELKFNSFYLANGASNSLTTAQLNNLYPDAQPGQCVSGTTVIYFCVKSIGPGTASWIRLSGIVP